MKLSDHERVVIDRALRWCSFALSVFSFWLATDLYLETLCQ